jgi:hypothetical protein
MNSRKLGYVLQGPVKFYAASLRFHTPSEHRINGSAAPATCPAEADVSYVLVSAGRQFPLEMQIVHYRRGPRTHVSPAVVVSVLFEFGVQNDFLVRSCPAHAIPAISSS